jgi:hypothetical protein
MNTKVRATEIYKEHIALATTDGALFRKTVMMQMVSEFGCSIASAATHYNNCKKAAPVEGLGRQALNKNVRRMGTGKSTVILQDDNECFTVLELMPKEGTPVIGRCQSFLLQGDASEAFDLKQETWPRSTWVMIQGLGPVHGDMYRLEEGEVEIKRYSPEAVTV